MLERLQKILSARGIASRRKAEEYIEQGLVKVNGKVAKVGDKANPETDTIEVDGAVLDARQEMLYYLLHKPVGVITSNVGPKEAKANEKDDDRGFEVTQTALDRLRKKKTEPKEQTVRDLLPEGLKGKVFPVGRLDKDSSGLLLMTNDGVLAYRLTHPKFYHEKEYEVTVKDPIKEGALRKMAEGLMIDGSKTKPAVIRRIDDTTFRISITEGRNRQIRRMASKVGSEVTVLKRVRIVNITDDKLQPGGIRLLTEKERDAILKAVLQ